MSPQVFQANWRSLGLLSLGFALAFQGCGGDDNSEPAPIVNAGAGGGVSKGGTGGGGGISGSHNSGGTNAGGIEGDAGASPGGADNSGGTSSSSGGDRG